MTIGFRIHSLTSRVDRGLVDRFRSIPVANVSDSMSRMTAGGPRLRPMHGGGVLAGPAFTVMARPGDLIIGDDDGLLCVPRLEAETIYRAAKTKNDAEEKQMAAIKAGRSDRSWVDAALARLGCEMPG